MLFRSWRKQYFPYYKANRAKAHEKSEFDWDIIYQTLNKIRDEIRDVFPYKNMKIESTEADDIIAILAIYRVLISLFAAR